MDERYSRLRSDVLLSAQEKQRALAALLTARAPRPLHELKVLEIGCGDGANLLELIWLGLTPGNLTGNELLPERTARARRNLPSETKIVEGDAAKLGFDSDSFDVVYQSTVFTSLLDSEFRQQLASRMWEWLKPGGGVLWYDFVYDNPNNADVRGVGTNEVRRLFPSADITIRRVTLAPPISRRVCRINNKLYHVFNAIPWLRTHVVCWIEKRVDRR
jgi:SAM-dependent methyltransferase